MTEYNLSAQEFGALLRLFMVSDPWPTSEIDRQRMKEMLDREARSRDYDDWVHAYHETHDE